MQAPLYAGLILAELRHLLTVAFGHGAVAAPASAAIMLSVLGLIDMVMIGGYDTFVFRLGLDDHPDQPESLNHVHVGVLKVKLATALIGISSIHLLKVLHRGRAPPRAGHALASHHPRHLRLLRLRPRLDGPRDGRVREIRVTLIRCAKLPHPAQTTKPA